MKNKIKIVYIALSLIIYQHTLFASEVLVYRNESMPWCGTVNGNDAGITIDILNEITKHGGPEFRFEELPWKRAQIYVTKNIGTAIIPLTRTEVRENIFMWIVELVQNQVRLTIARNQRNEVSTPSPFTLANSKNLTIGIILGSAMIPTLKQLGFSKLEKVPTAHMNVKKLRYGRIDAMAESKWVDNYLWHQIGEKANDLIPGPNIGKPKYIYLAAGLDFPLEIATDIRNAMDKVRASGKLKEILNKWTQ